MSARPTFLTPLGALNPITMKLDSPGLQHEITNFSELRGVASSSFGLPRSTNLSNLMKMVRSSTSSK